jgi:hypothetical protein
MLKPGTPASDPVRRAAAPGRDRYWVILTICPSAPAGIVFVDT